ncbi:BAI1-associated protein 3 [Orussus abietinus]|uniref:BAI1-associated protein 3 n=1 Tax=Orussus abietinus TaxID=222816 RepID=UPI000C715CAB|nr:BAI1-associated protein 3 [Orussus abietinus]
MSFFNSLHQYVTDSVANLNLSPKRFTFGREDTATVATTTTTGSAATPVVQLAPHGFPKVVPSPGTATSLYGRPPSTRRRPSDRAIDETPAPRIDDSNFATNGSEPQPTMAPLAPTTTSTSTPDSRRGGSFRRPGTAVPTNRPLLDFCRRRPSWPEIDARATSGVQETDGSFFESFTALSWKQENRRLMALRERKGRTGKEAATSTERAAAAPRLGRKDMERLYVEVLYTIANTVGASTGQYAHYKEDLYEYAREAFRVPLDRHRRCLGAASEEKPPIVVLSVVVVEAEGLEAKDANGYSDPYCMLGIQPGNAGLPSSPRVAPPGPRAARALSDAGDPEDCHPEKLRKHHSFRLSFKRKEHGSRREHRESLGGAVPAKFIRATSVRPHTLNPRWEEKFRFDIDDVATDILHLDIWDHDDESSVFDAVSKLNEVRGVKGLGRFFKQIAQSARSGSQDDFLGCVNVPLQDIPSTGLDRWYELEARTQRSNVQGRIRLKLWLSTRENRGTSEEDGWGELRQQERLYAVILGHEVARQGENFDGELPQTALTILHQHAVQSDASELRQAMVRWVASSRQPAVEPRVLLRLLRELDDSWHRDELDGAPTSAGSASLSRDEQACLADSFNDFLEIALGKIRRHRLLFPPSDGPAIARLDHLLRCLGLLSSMDAFRKCCPFNREIRGEIVAALRKGTHEWYEDTRRRATTRDQEPDQDADAVLQELTTLVTALLVDLQLDLEYYDALFESAHQVPYFSVVYKQLDKLLAEHVARHLENPTETYEELGSRVTAACLQLRVRGRGDEEYVLPPRAEIGTPVFELYLALQELVGAGAHLPPSDRKGLALCAYYRWFEPALDKWLDLAKLKAVQRMGRAVELDAVCAGELIVKHCTSAVDAVACFQEVKEFWKKLAWPDVPGSYPFVLKVVDAVCCSATRYAELTHQRLTDAGYYDEQPQAPFGTIDEVIAQMCVAVNGLEYVRRWLVSLERDLGLAEVLEALEAQAPAEATRPQWRSALLSPLEQAPGQMLLFVDRIVSRIGSKMRPALRKAAFHLAWSPDSLPTAEAMTPLLEYLDLHLAALNAALLPANFDRVLHTVWEVALAELAGQADAGVGDKPAVFYERLHEALHSLADSFHAEGQGLPREALRSEGFLDLEERLRYHRMETPLLIDRYHRQRLRDQANATSQEFGVLSVRAYLNHDSLCVEIMSAREVIPLDPNGFSDPFVIVELLPRRTFARCSEQHTSVRKRTLNPMFDEYFEFPVSVEQCRSPDAMILFTVMDHDVLTANDFAGEAFLGLSSIPGVVDSNASIDNFHGLKHLELSLMHQRNRYHPILRILETRVGDKTALDFVKKQKQRLAPST